MVLDTNIIIAYLAGEEKVVEAVRGWFGNGIGLFISAVTYAEVLALPEANESDVAKMRQFMDSFVVISVDKTLAETVAMVRRSEKLKFPDAAIIATALATSGTLVTRDKRLHTVRGVQSVSL